MPPPAPTSTTSSRPPSNATPAKFHPDALPEQLVPYTRAVIGGIRAGQAYTEMGW